MVYGEWTRRTWKRRAAIRCAGRVFERSTAASQVTGELLYKQGYGIPVSPLFPNLSAALSIEIMNLQQSGALEIYEKAWIPDVVCGYSAVRNVATHYGTCSCGNPRCQCCSF
jgi:hypothetical protein